MCWSPLSNQSHSGPQLESSIRGQNLEQSMGELLAWGMELDLGTPVAYSSDRH